ncbi:hypothetical protein F0562_021706 [Nyssa sinensis]|uniref:Uncharacterized protein n=1 Tax=Nyssa sinensis TaxID=561372 RepID=A0A5J5BLK4_9ASTE|nr:hypothetical protein F0562_021706 [Nyssa sinensis]
MVSIRKRKLLGLYSGTNLYTDPLFHDSSNAPKNPVRDTKPGNVHPVPLVDVNQPVTILKVDPGSSKYIWFWIITRAASMAFREQWRHEIYKWPDKKAEYWTF